MPDGSLNPRRVGNTPASSRPHIPNPATSDLDKAVDNDTSSSELEPHHVPVLAFPKLLAPMRNVIAASTRLDDFLGYLKEHAKGTIAEIVEIGIEDDDNKFSGLISKEAIEFDRAGSNLLVEALSMLKYSTDYRTKAFLAAIGFQINEDILVNDFIIPSLDKRNYFENIEDNNKFVKMLLGKLSRVHLVRIFSLVKFDGINNNNEFAKSIASLPAESLEKVLNALVDVSVGDSPSSTKIEGVGGYVHVENKERIQSLILLVYEKLKDGKKKFPKEPLERLYKSADDTKINDKAMEFINGCDDVDPDKFLLEFVLDESKKDDSCERVRRFWAIDDYVTKKGANAAAPGLRRVLLECETPLVVNYAVYKLANCCDVEGKNVLVNAIRQKIRLNEPSLPLAFVVSHIDLESSFGDVFFKLLNSEFPEARGISAGFDSISNLQIAPARRNKDNGITFSHDSDSPPVTPITVFQKIGIIPMVDKIVAEQISQSVKTGTPTRDAASLNHYEINLAELIRYSFVRYKIDMNALMSVAVSQSRRTKPGVYSYLLYLGGAPSSGLEPTNIDELQDLFPGKKIE